MSILNYTYTYLTTTKSITAYKAGQDLTQETITYTQDHVLKNLSQHIFHGIYSLTLYGQLYFPGSWYNDLTRMTCRFLF